MSRTQLDYLSSSFELHIRAENKSPKTIGIYLAAPRKFAGWMADAPSEPVSAMDVLRHVLDREGRDLSAAETIRAEYAEQYSLKQLWAEYDTIATAALA